MGKIIGQAIAKIVDKKDLTYQEAFDVMNEIMNGESTMIQNAAYLAALSTKSARAETIDEIAGSAAAMRNHALKVVHPFDVLEIVGTGGDHSKSINISTTASFIVAAAGVKIAKHGNRAASSKSGAADCLEALGAKIDLSPEACLKLLQDVGFCFMFAQKYHASMKYVGPIRKELGIRTVFNILGPLTNPANPKYFLLGVYDEYLLEPVAHVLLNLGAEHGLVIHGNDGFDEISISDETSVCEFSKDKPEKISCYKIKPEDFGLTRGKKEDVVGGTAQENAAISRNILSGADQSAKRDIVVLNAGAALYAAKKVNSILEGVELAKQLIDNGLALKKLNDFVAMSNQL